MGIENDKELIKLEKDPSEPVGRLTLIKEVGGYNNGFYFKDSTGYFWFFSNTEQLWSVATKEQIERDRYVSEDSKATGKEFQDVESATLFALKEHFLVVKALFAGDITLGKYRAETDKKYENRIASSEGLISGLNEIVELIEDIQQEKDSNKKYQLKEVLAKAMAIYRDVNADKDFSFISKMKEGL